MPLSLTQSSSYGAFILVCIGSFGCDRSANVETPANAFGEADLGADGRANEANLALLGAPPRELLIGELRLTDDPIIDGDTIRARALDASVRLLALDTEEIDHDPPSREPWGDDFERYRREKRAEQGRFPKYETPMGYEAKRFAEAFFADASVVRLHRDHPNEIRGKQGRYLAYADVKKRGRWVSYNIECVRAGLSPYFTKYGYSRRFHDAFTRAEAEARAEKRGIWNPDAEGYGDYDARVRWWNARADSIRASERELSAKGDFVLLSRSDAMARLEALVGREATVLGTVDRIEHFSRLVRVSLSTTSREVFPVIFFDRRVFEETGLERSVGASVRVRGTIERYEKGSYQTLQIVVTNPRQVRLSSPP